MSWKLIHHKSQTTIRNPEKMFSPKKQKYSPKLVPPSSLPQQSRLMLSTSFDNTIISSAPTPIYNRKFIPVEEFQEFRKQIETKLLDLRLFCNKIKKIVKEMSKFYINSHKHIGEQIEQIFSKSTDSIKSFMDGLKTRLPSDEQPKPFISQNSCQSDFLPQEISNLSIQPIQPVSESVQEPPQFSTLRLSHTTSEITLREFRETMPKQIKFKRKRRAS